MCTLHLLTCKTNAVSHLSSKLMLYGDINFFVNLDFPLIRAKCISHNRIYKDKNAEGSLFLGNWSQQHVVLQTHLLSHFILSIIPLKSKDMTFFTAMGSGPPTPFSSEHKVLQVAQRVLRVRLSSLQVQNECSPATLSAWLSSLGTRYVFCVLGDDDRCQGAYCCKSCGSTQVHPQVRDRGLHKLGRDGLLL